MPSISKSVNCSESKIIEFLSLFCRRIGSQGSDQTLRYIKKYLSFVLRLDVNDWICL